MFKLIKKNRESIKQADVNKIVESIKVKNLLYMRPIIVNGDFEILDGQHRFLAAKQLGVEIFYDQREDLTSGDIISLNNAKTWGIGDYYNFHILEGREEYIKLKKFMEKYNLSLKVSLGIFYGLDSTKFTLFKKGEYVFNSEIGDEIIDSCIQIREGVRRSIGYSNFADTARFWKASIKIALHPDFNLQKLLSNMTFLSDRVNPKISVKLYFEMLREIHNYRNPVKISREYESE
jgi:hypothetical protein